MDLLLQPINSTLFIRYPRTLSVYVSVMHVKYGRKLVYSQVSIPSGARIAQSV